MKWVDAPPEFNRGKGRPSQVLPVVAELAKHPGKWALVKTGMKTAASGRAWRKAGCEAVARSNGDGLYDIYARWPK